MIEKMESDAESIRTKRYLLRKRNSKWKRNSKRKQNSKLKQNSKSKRNSKSKQNSRSNEGQAADRKQLNTNKIIKMWEPLFSCLICSNSAVTCASCCSAVTRACCCSAWTRASCCFKVAMSAVDSDICCWMAELARKRGK